MEHFPRLETVGMIEVASSFALPIGYHSCAMAPDASPSLRQLFLVFLRLGFTAFGGPSTVAYIRKVAVHQKRWLDEATFNAGVALCQMLPGATAMQVAAYTGLQLRGVSGAAASFIGFGLPAFLLMTMLAALYASMHTLPVVVAAFTGLQALIVAIVANAALSFGRTTLHNWQQFTIAGIAAVLFGLGLNPLFVIGLAALGGLALIPPQPLPVPTGSRSTAPTSTTKPLVFILAAAALGLLGLFVAQPALFNLTTLLMRIDLTAFGGGFASVPLMFHEVVDVRRWLDGPTFMNGIVLGQVTPGPIVITATFIGYLLYGWPGGLLATVGIFFPSFVLVVATAPYLERLRASATFNKIIAGVLCSFVGLLVTVTLRFAGNVHWDQPLALLAASGFVALLLKVDLLWIVASGLAISVLLPR
jgi:chromate transporter